MVNLLVIGMGGFIGAIARYGVARLVARLSGGTFPLGTLLANLLGCLLIGALMAIVEERQGLSEHARLFLIIGLLGSFTTFSTFGYDTYLLLRAGAFAAALANLLANVVLGLLAVIAGRAALGALAAHGWW